MLVRGPPNSANLSLGTRGGGRVHSGGRSSASRGCAGRGKRPFGDAPGGDPPVATGIRNQGRVADFAGSGCPTIQRRRHEEGQFGHRVVSALLSLCAKGGRCLLLVCHLCGWF